MFYTTHGRNRRSVAVGVAGILIGFLWMVRIYRADPNPTRGRAHRDRADRRRARTSEPEQSPARYRSRWRPRQTVTRERPWTCHAHRGRRRPCPRRYRGRPTGAATAGRQGTQRLGPGVVVRTTDAPGTNPRPPARSGQGASPTRKSKASPASTIAPAEQPASTAPRWWASVNARPRHSPRARPAGMPACPRQVDEVGLADRLGGGGIVGGRTIATSTGSTSAPSSPKWATPIVAQRVKTSSPSGYEAVGRTATHGRDRPVAMSNPASNPSISGRNSPAPTSATGPGIAESLQAPCPNPDATATLA